MKKRICCFCETWESGGIESFLNNVLGRLDMQQFEIDLVAAEIRPSVFTSELEKGAVRFVALSGKQRNLLKNHKMFRELLRERQYDAAHFNLFQGLSLRYVQIAKQEGVPVRIAHSHNTALRESLTRPLKLALHGMGRRAFTGCATDLWACSRDAAEFLFDSGVLQEKGFRFVPNGIDTNRFCFDESVRNEVRSELGLTNQFVIGSVGRLCYQKNQNFLLDVFAEILESRPESRLLLVGEGEQEEELKAKAERLNVAHKVIFYGVTDRVEHLYAAMDVFAFPSLFEGLGIVAVEAQASGLPVVCSEHIPQEAHVTQLICAVGLNEGKSGWAQALLDRSPDMLRQDASQLVRDAGFDISGVAQVVQQGYRAPRVRMPGVF